MSKKTTKKPQSALPKPEETEIKIPWEQTTPEKKAIPPCKWVFKNYDDHYDTACGHKTSPAPSCKIVYNESFCTWCGGMVVK